ncbi:MAG: glycoside hydrolase family 5 protein [Clostridiales bacterium]|jgi:aryl-phospho-beta-D-glucosidase BglC (GH1 family)|nr:glycoside hydrolase family 5 protein [Clostridiales bacterium]
MFTRIKKILKITVKTVSVFLITALSAALTVYFGTLYIPSERASGSTRHALVDERDFLITDGTLVKNLNDEIVSLRGTNAGGWLVYERWQCPANAPDQKTLIDVLTDRFGAAVRDELIAVYEESYWQTRDFDNLAEMGVTLVRLPFTVFNLYGDDGELRENAFSRIDWFVENCAERGIYVVIDLHGAFGSQNGEHHSGQTNDGSLLYKSPENRAKTKELWKIIAARFKDNPAVAAYDLLNEPDNDTGRTGAEQMDYFDELYDAVRSVDGRHIIMIESCWTVLDIAPPIKYGWKNVIYQYHHYVREFSGDEDMQKRLSDLMVLTVRSVNFAYNVPTYMGEFAFFDNFGAWEYALSAYNRVGFMWTTWSYKAKGDTSWGLYNQFVEDADVYNDSADTIREKWSKVGYEYAVESRVKPHIEKYF